MTPQRPILMTVRCRRPGCGRKIHAEFEAPGSREAICPGCGARTTIRLDSETAETGLMVHCPLCDGGEFFVRKDFPQKIGLGLVVLFGLTATILYYFERVAATFGVLGSLVIIDAIVYLLVGKVTVCYRCRAEFRNAAYNPDHRGFDLATSEKYGFDADGK